VKAVSGEPAKAVLKHLKPEKANDSKARGRMAQEVTNLRVLRSAGGKVPQVLDGNTERFEDPSIPLYFVMEYIQGKTLAETVQESNGLGVKASVGIALDLCSTMSVAIMEGIVHRDIKPENIICHDNQTWALSTREG
jgi:serine/threonine protein kinase